MEENFDHKISRLSLTNFTCFSQADFDFSSGINVFIGENGTGKTHILKCLYSLSNKEKGMYNDFFSKNEYQEVNIRFMQFAFALKDIFKIESFDFLPLYKNKDANKPFDINFFFDNDNQIELNATSQKLNFKTSNKNFDEILNTSILYIPVNEMLTLFPGFISAYNNRENAFDRTHYNLALALDNMPLKNGGKEEADKLLHDIKSKTGIEVFRKDKSFFLKMNNNIDIEASLSATGINKLAQLIYLIMNGSLTKDSILFWDEPEVNLNPKYISLVVNFLQTLAKAGVQIFVATHDYLLTHQLSLAAEYRAQTDAPLMKFFSLSKGENGTIVESGNTLVEINNNAILDEYAAFYDLESSLFVKSRP